MFFDLHRGLGPRTKIAASVAALACCAQAQLAGEGTLALDLLDNGSGLEEIVAPAGDLRARSVPWWIGSGTPRTGPAQVGVLELAPGAVLTQPIAAYGPLAEGVVIRGRVAGRGRVRWIDGRGEALSLEVIDREFELSGSDFVAQFQRAPQPRFLLEISAPAQSAGARFSGLRALVPLPLPSEAALKEELRGLCDEVFKTWLERGVDRDGPRATAFLTARFDAVSGARLRVDGGGIHPLYESLLEAVAVTEEPVWRAGLESYLEDFFALTFHPKSGMPREWDGELDLPQDHKPIEVARYLSFLLDLCERGPAAFRERALAQAQRMAETILARGRLPDHAIAVKYTPSTGALDLSAAPIRKLDVAAQLARLGRRNGDPRLSHAASAALAELEFTHYWGGSWQRIDPDFDDSWGNWGAKSTTMLEAYPEDPVFRRFTARGFAHFAPIWLDALRFGGSIAADQTRCWELLLRYAEVEPSAHATLDPILRAAVRAHFKGEQYDNGAWGDVTFASFSPRATLNVGDFTGYPSNLVWGLALAYRRGGAPHDEATRAMFTAVLRSSKAAYRRPFGWITTREAAPGQNLSGGELRMLLGATEMLEHLTR